MAMSTEPYQEYVPSCKKRDSVLRFVSVRHADRFWFGQLPASQRVVIRDTIATSDGRLAYIKNSKAGNTTVAHLIYQLEKGKIYTGDIHHARFGLNARGGNRRELLDALIKGFSFSTVRNPERRLVSGYFDFFVKKSNPQSHLHLGPIVSFGFSEGKNLSYNFDAVLEYLTASLKRSEITTDRHFRPQHINLGHGIFDLSYVARIENLQEDLRKIKDLSGFDLYGVAITSLEKKNKTGSEEYNPTPEQKRKIEKLYARDYEVYGY